MTTDLEIVQQSPDLAESDFLEADDVTLATVLHVRFPAPDGTLSGTQKFRRRVRKTAGSPTPTLDMWLYEDGVAVRKLLDAVSVTSTSGQVVEGEWQPNEITNPALVECYCISTPGEEAEAEGDFIEITASGTWVVPAGVQAIDVFLVGGGGGGASNNRGAGGGGYTTSVFEMTVTPADEWTVTIGDGGAPGVSAVGEVGQPGLATTFVRGGTTLSASPGLGGQIGSSTRAGGDGGSGGSSGSTGGAIDGGDGGTDGGDGETISTYIAGVGQGSTTYNFAEAFGTLYAGGGACGTPTSEGVAGTGGAGGGGDGGLWGAAGSPGGVNTGGGGGSGSNDMPGGQGSSGIVLVRTYPTGAWEVDNAAYDSISADLSGPTTAGDFRSGEFRPDGGVFYAVLRGDSTVHAWSLATPFDLTSPTHLGSVSMATEMGSEAQASAVAHGILIRKDTGRDMYIINRTEIWHYKLTTPWQPWSGITQHAYQNLGATLSRAHDLCVSRDGLRFYIDDRTNQRVYQFTASTAWDITTLTLTSQLDISARHSEVRGIQVNSAETRFWLLDTVLQEVQQYNMSTPGDLTTATFSKAFDISAEPGSNRRGLAVAWNGARMVVTDATSRIGYQYSIEVA